MHILKVSMYRLAIMLAVVLCGLGAWLALKPSYAQTSAGPAQPMITQPVVESNLVRLFSNTRPEANAANDRGMVPDSLPMPHMMLQLRRPPAQEQALQTVIDQLHDPNSPNFHHWLSASEIGAQFGPAASDIQTISGWLQRQGFTVNTVYSNRMIIDYSGTAGQVRTAFHTELHYLDVNGVTRFANMSDPQIPAALASAVVGIVSLNNIPPRPLFKPKAQYTVGGGEYALTPPDLATIYNFNPLFTAGTTGQGQTIYLIETTNLYTNADWTTFRSTFGIPVSSYPGASLTTINPGGCANQVNAADGEAILDAEYASAAAPSAAIVIASCENILIAIQTLVNSASPPAIMSISYGYCEAGIGDAANQAFYTAYQTGAAGGMSIFVSAGDGGADTCDNSNTANYATSGISASGLASTPYNVAVGGTDFSDTYSGTNSTYWNSTNTGTYGSAKSYIPEIPWNSSCGSQLIATYLGFGTTYGSSGLCNSSDASNYGLLNIRAGSGAPSSCAMGSGGTCQGWPKPSWQSGFLGNPADGVRDLPDVSLFAASGVWGHYYVFCFSDPQNGGTPCTGAPSGWSGGGGTSFASPIWAGIQALVNQQAGGKQGLPNSRLYALAATEYGASGSSSCNASNGNTVGSSCLFYDVTLGDNDVPCQSGSPNCYDPSGTYGVLSTSTSSFAPAFNTQTGWDFATGIGTVNVYNLVTNWTGTGSALQVTPTTSIVASGLQGGPFSPPSFSYTLSATSGNVNFSISGVPTWLTPSATSGTASSTGTTVTFTVNANANSLAAAAYGPTTITFTNSDTGQGTQTRTATLTVIPPSLQVTPTTNISASGTQGGPFTPPSFSYTLSAASGNVSYSISNVPNWLTPSSTSGTASSSGTTVTFTVNANANSLTPNTYVSSINFNNTTNGQGNTTRVATLTVNAPPLLQVMPTTNMVASGAQGGPFSPSSFQYQLSASAGSVNYSISGLPNWLTASSTSGTASPSASTVTFTVNANASGLAVGTYGPFAITFTNADTGQGTQTRTATLTVNLPSPALQVVPTSNIVVAGNQGALPLSSFPYALSATAGTVNYSISGVPTWLTPSSTSGNVSSSGTTVTFTVNANANSLAPGIYGPTTIIFTNTDTGQGTQSRTAALTVNPPAIQVSPPTDIAAFGTHGGTFSPSSFRYMLNAAKGSLSYSITNVPSWLTVSSKSGTVTTTKKTITFTVNASARNLMPGTYDSSINFNNTTSNQGNTTRAAALTVNPKQYTITVRASPSSYGIVSGGGKFAEGTSHTVTATPNSGHTFFHWTNNGRVVSTSASYTFTLSANVTLVAVFQ